MQTKHLTMKHKLLSFYLLAFVLLSDFRLFAQELPGEESDQGNLQDDGDTDAPQAPINGKLILLAITGLAFAFYVYRRHRAAKA